QVGDNSGNDLCPVTLATAGYWEGPSQPILNPMRRPLSAPLVPRTGEAPGRTCSRSREELKPGCASGRWQWIPSRHVLEVSRHVREPRLVSQSDSVTTRATRDLFAAISAY